MWQQFLLIKKEKPLPPLYLIILLFDMSTAFDHLPVNSDLETSKKRAVFSQYQSKTHTIEQVL